MKRTNLGFYLSLLVLSLVIGQCLATTCPGGYYDSDNYERPCYRCDAGSYCPGDGKMYTCPTGSISNSQASSCTTCSTKRCNAYHTICLLPDTPPNAQELIQGSSLVINSKSPYYYITNYNSYGQPTKTMQLTVAGKKGVPVVVYASYNTGKPSETNAQYFNKGVNATISFQQDVSQLLYLYIAPVEKDDYDVAELKLFKYLDMVTTLKPNEVNHLVLNAELSQYDRNMLLFRLDDVPVGSRVNFTLNCGFWKKDWAFAFSYTLYQSTLPNIQYPNENNANVIVKSLKSTQPSTSTIFKMPPNSNQFSVAFYYDNTYYYGEMFATAQIIN